MDNIDLVVEDICNWIRTKKEETNSKGFIIGISGGKDSAVVAGLLVKAIGSKNVLGVMMPNGKQPDISDSEKVCLDLDIPYITVNINDAYKGVIGNLPEITNKETIINIQPRLRMTVLYALAQEKGYLVCGTGNKSESYIGYCTKWGDNVSDINPIGNFDTEEVVALGDYLKVTTSVVHKTPTDGLSGLSDEEKIGFTYKELNAYMATGNLSDSAKKDIIDKKHKESRHKFEPVPTYQRK